MAGNVRLEILAHRPAGHESLAVVVPWSERRFQYTVKDVARPATGWFEVDGVRTELPAGASWAVLDHGRGRWPYRMTWNWGAASGVVDGRTIGLQLGGKWTDGTPSSENWVRLDGRLHKIENHLDWRYDPQNWTAPWTITGPDVRITFRPEHHSRHLFDRWIVMSRADSCFGHYEGRIRLPGEEIAFSGVFGHVEEVERRW